MTDSIVVFCCQKEPSNEKSLPAVLVIDSLTKRFGATGVQQQHPAGVEVVLQRDFASSSSQQQPAVVLLQFEAGGGTLLITEPHPSLPSQLAKWLQDPQSIANQKKTTRTTTTTTSLMQESSSSSPQQSKRKAAPSNIQTTTTNGNKLPSFPTLRVTFNNELFPLNSPIPVPIENDLFQGKALVLFRPQIPEEDPYWNERVFSKKRRRVSVSVGDV